MFVSLHYDAKCNLDNSKFSVQYLKKLTPDDDHSISGDRVQLPPPPAPGLKKLLCSRGY